MTLFECYRDVFHFCAAIPNILEHKKDLEFVRKRARKELEDAAARAGRNFARQDLEWLEHGLIGLVDDLVMKNTLYEAAWVPTLEKEILDTEIAGRDVFRYIDDLTKTDRDQDLTVCFFYILALGFQANKTDREWVAILDKLHRDVGVELPDEALTPEGYRVEKTEAARLPVEFRFFRALAAFFICMLTLFFAYRFEVRSWLSKVDERSQVVYDTLEDDEIKGEVLSNE